MAVEPEKDGADPAAKGTSEEAPKAGDVVKTWEERRASRPPVTPSTSDEPFDQLVPAAASVGVVVGEEKVRHGAGRILWQARIG